MRTSAVLATEGKHAESTLAVDSRVNCSAPEVRGLSVVADRVLSEARASSRP
jgi:hypothetical protein